MRNILNRATRQTGTGWIYLAFSFAMVSIFNGLFWGFVVALSTLIICIIGQLCFARFIDGLRGQEMWIKAGRRAMGVRDGRRPFQTFPSDL